MTEKGRNIGLSETNINLIVGLFFFGLLLGGPIDPPNLLIRLAYLIILPVALWLVLRNLGKSWNADEAKNDRLNRTIVGILAGLLFINAYVSFTSSSHTECTQYVRSTEGGGGRECVGDYVKVEGRDISGALIYAGLGIAAVWYSAFREDGN